MNDREERQPEHQVTFADFENSAAGSTVKEALKAKENKYRRIIAAELAVIVLLIVTLGVLITGLKKPYGRQEAPERPMIESAAETVPDEEESAGKEESEGSQIWYPADYATEPDDDIRIARNDMLMLPSGSVLRKVQIDWEKPEQYFFATDVEKNDKIYPRIEGKFFPGEEPLPELSYLKLLHYNADGDVQIGELLVPREDAENILGIFLELFEAECRIPKMRLPEDYWTEDAAHTIEKSDADGNTAAFSGFGEDSAPEIRLCLAEEQGPGEDICRIFREHGYGPEKEPGGGKAIFVKDRQQE